MTGFARTTPMLAAVAAALLAVPRPAQATFELILESGAQTQTYFGSGGVLNVPSASINNFNIQFVGGSSNSPGAGGLAALDIQAFNVVNHNSGTATLTATLVDTGFTTPSGSNLNALGLLSGQMNDANHSKLGLSLYAMANNSQTPSGSPIMSFSAQATGNTGNPISLNQSNNATFASGSGPFSLADVLTFTTDAGGSLTSATGKEHVTGGSPGPPAVPAPPAALMALLGLPFLGLGRYLRRRATA